MAWLMFRSNCSNEFTISILSNQYLYIMTVCSAYCNIKLILNASTTMITYYCMNILFTVPTRTVSPTKFNEKKYTIHIFSLFSKKISGQLPRHLAVSFMNKKANYELSNSTTRSFTVIPAPVKLHVLQ